jgi:antigen flippase
MCPPARRGLAILPDAVATDDQQSTRRILTVTSIVGGATIATILIGIVRNKLIAVMTGPEGIGLLGVFTNILGTATAIAGLGLGLSAVRNIAADQQSGAARRALWRLTWPLGLVGGAALFLLRDPVARWTIDEPGQGLAVGLLGIGVLLSLVAIAQSAVIQGMQRIGDLSRGRIAGALAGAAIGVAAIAWLGLPGLVVAAIAVPLGNVVGFLPFTPRATPPAAPDAIRREGRSMLGLGAVLMVTAMVASLSQLLVRTMVVRDAGLAAGGLYQAAYAISAMNIALVLTAMAADYYPRLSSHGEDHAAQRTLVNDQLHAALLLGAPLLVGLMAAAPIAVSLLYSGRFDGAVDILRWQLFGDLLKIPGWALGFLLLARGDRRAYASCEFLFALLYPIATMLLLPRLGIAAAGIGYALAYAGYSLAMIAIARTRHGLVLSRRQIATLLALAGVLAAIFALASVTMIGGLVVGCLVATALAAGTTRWVFKRR